MINVTCPSCNKVYKADESLLGKQVKCQNKDCGKMFDVKPNGPPPPPPKVQRTFGLVWLVFFWIIQGVGCLVVGPICISIGEAKGGVIEITRNMFGSRGLGSSLEVVFLELLGLLIFHYGLLLLVACYGLWTFRRWALSLAKGLAIVFVVLNILVFIITLVNRMGIVLSVAGMFISVGILVYLFGSVNLRDRLQHLQQYIRTDGLQGNEWS
jgi:hypothetical protein